MSGVFPDSGVPASDAYNSIQDPNTVGCSGELWYSTSRCNPRFDPKAANAVTAEIVNLVNCAGLPYDCTKLDNLCDAVTKMITDTIVSVITGCLPFTFPSVAAGVCSLEQIGMTTDANGCKKIVRYNESSVPAIAVARNNSVVGNSYPRNSRPLTPTNPATYYTQDLLGFDQLHGTINNAKLVNNELARATFTLACATRLAIRYAGVVEFEPADNPPTGTLGSICLRIDGNFIVASNGSASAVSRFTNFVSAQDGTMIVTLAAGIHTVQAYVTAGGSLQPTQVGILGDAIETAGTLSIKPAVG